MEHCVVLVFMSSVVSVDFLAHAETNISASLTITRSWTEGLTFKSGPRELSPSFLLRFRIDGGLSSFDLLDGRNMIRRSMSSFPSDLPSMISNRFGTRKLAFFIFLPLERPMVLPSLPKWQWTKFLVMDTSLFPGVLDFVYTLQQLCTISSFGGYEILTT